MAVNLVETGPKLDCTRDNRIHDHFSNWKEKQKVTLILFLQTAPQNRSLPTSSYGFGCNSNKARNKIVRKGENITLNEVIEYL